MFPDSFSGSRPYRLLWETLKESPNIIEKYDQEEKIWKQTTHNFLRDFVIGNEPGFTPDMLEEEEIQSSVAESKEKETIPVYRCNLSKLGVELVIIQLIVNIKGAFETLSEICFVEESS